MPPAFDRPILVVVVALLEMALCVAFTAGHGTNRQHGSTLALFEIRDQLVTGHSWHTDESRGNSKGVPLADRLTVGHSSLFAVPTPWDGSPKLSVSITYKTARDRQKLCKSYKTSAAWVGRNAPEKRLCEASDACANARGYKTLQKYIMPGLWLAPTFVRNTTNTLTKGYQLVGSQLLVILMQAAGPEYFDIN